MFLFKNPENGICVETHFVEKYLFFLSPPPALREAGKGGDALGSYGTQDAVAQGFPLALLPVPSVLGTIRKVVGLKRLRVRSA